MICHTPTLLSGSTRPLFLVYQLLHYLRYKYSTDLTFHPIHPHSWLGGSPRPQPFPSSSPFPLRVWSRCYIINIMDVPTLLQKYPTGGCTVTGYHTTTSDPLRYVLKRHCGPWWTPRNLDWCQLSSKMRPRGAASQTAATPSLIHLIPC